MNTYTDVIRQCKENDKKCQDADSIEPLKEVMQMPEADSQALELLLDALLSCGRKSEAVRYVSKLAQEKRDRKKFVTPKSLNSFGTILHQTCRPDSVYPQAYLRKFKTGFPESPEPYCLETHEFMAFHRYEEALESVKQQKMLGGQCVYCLDAYSWVANHFGVEGPSRLDIANDLTKHSDEEIWRACFLATSATVSGGAFDSISSLPSSTN
jgi:hypothetical protein